MDVTCHERQEPKISVIIPIYNVEPYIRKCLDSVVNQTYHALEIILVDDGSPDNCGAICEEYAVADSRIKVIHKKNGGLSAARNDALKLATGAWISFVDPDDWCELDMYECVMKTVTDDGPDIIVFGVYRELGKRRREIYPFPSDFVTEDKDIIAKMQLSAFNRRFAPISGTWCQAYPWDKLYKAALIKGNELKFAENVKANEDVIFNIHAYQFTKKVAYVNKLLYHFRYNPASIGNKYTPDRLEIDREICNEFMRIGERYAKTEEYYQGVYGRVIANAVALGNRFIFNKKNKMSYFDKWRYLHQVEKEDYIYNAFNLTDRKNLGYLERFVTLNRHHNTVLRYIALKLSLIKIRFV